MFTDGSLVTHSAMELDATGVATPYTKPSPLGGMGLFCTGKPHPIEYKPDLNRGFLSAEESDRLWGSQSELASQYLMEICLDTEWYRDEVDGNGELRPITAISRYTEFGQKMVWDEDAGAMVMDRGDCNIYLPLFDPKLNPAAYANDRCYGRVDPEESPDEYDEIDFQENALEQIPCLRRGEDGKLWWSSMWLYPRKDWVLQEGVEVEITYAYGWPVEPWMKP